MSSMLARNWLGTKTATAHNYKEAKNFMARGLPFKHSTCHSERDIFATEKGEVPVTLFFSYDTVVGFAFDVNGVTRVYSTSERYSVTTSKQQSKWHVYAFRNFRHVEHIMVDFPLDNIHTLHDLVNIAFE